MARRVSFSDRLMALFVPVLLNEICNVKHSHHCAPSSCGDIRNISYPFRLKEDPKRCGAPKFTLSCENNHTVLHLRDAKYYVRKVDYDNQTIRLVDSGVLKDNYFFIPRYVLSYYNFSDLQTTDLLWREEFTVQPRRSNQTKLVVFWICEKPMNSPLYNQIPACFDDQGHSSDSSFSRSKRYRYFRVGTMNASEMEDFCQAEGMFLTSWPGSDGPNISCSDFLNQLQYGFELPYSQPGARIFSGSPEFPVNSSWDEAFCAGTAILAQSAPYLGGMYRGLIIVLGAPMVIAFLVHKWRRRHSSMYDDIEEYLQIHNNLMPIRYSYSEIKKITKSFKEKLGEGGYGTVYKGMLRSGHLVAIKMLDKSKGNGQEFINEVATVGRVHHVNVVQLIGFCNEGSKRAFVYEFMPNGSLNKHIFSPEGNLSLIYKRIYEIALGVARGIDYLHRGCDMQILHFDIKPHNILLDENFKPKVSDFGLARLFPVENIIVSLTATRGTLGYMAPELFYKNIGGVSYKADVYSFGKLLMEMASRRKNVNAFAENSSQIYFPTWICDQLHQEKNIEMEELDEEEKKLFKKMVIVALWCIQMKPSERPSMSKVVEMLEGEVQSLQMPPKPSLQSIESPIIEAKENSDQASSTYQFENQASHSLSKNKYSSYVS